jgi:hypothetical protein
MRNMARATLLPLGALSQDVRRGTASTSINGD